MSVEMFLGISIGVISVMYGYLIYDEWRKKK